MDKTEINENETYPVKPAESESCRDKKFIIGIANQFITHTTKETIC
jgi:hypothetical protein